jgi:hypothetical protein
VDADIGDPPAGEVADPLAGLIVAGSAIRPSRWSFGGQDRQPVG